MSIDIVASKLLKTLWKKKQLYTLLDVNHMQQYNDQKFRSWIHSKFCNRIYAELSRKDFWRIRKKKEESLRARAKCLLKYQGLWIDDFDEGSYSKYNKETRKMRCDSTKNDVYKEKFWSQENGYKMNLCKCPLIII